MIYLTRLDGREVVVNSDLIVTVERTPDTMVTLTTGDKLLVREPIEEIVERAAAFRYRVLQGPGRAPVPPWAPDLGSAADLSGGKKPAASADEPGKD